MDQLEDHLLELTDAAIEKILEASKPGGYGVRTIIEQIVQSDLFLNK